MARLTERGFGLVETLVAMPALVIALAGVLCAVYLCIAQAWLADAAEEAALCVAEKVLTEQCRREIQNKTSTVLPIGHYSRLSIESYGDQVIVRYTFEALNIDLSNEITLHLPVSKTAVGL